VIDPFEKDKGTTHLEPTAEVKAAKVKWLRENYGDNFVCNDIEFVYKADIDDFIGKVGYNKLHYMTSTSTSKLGETYYERGYYRVADYLGFYGTDHELYNSKWAFLYKYNDEQERIYTIENQVANNESYFVQLGWEKNVPKDGIYNNWMYTTTEGLPIGIDEYGFITMNIKLENEDDYSKHTYTIEEYNEFVQNNTWEIRGESRYSYIEGAYVGSGFIKYVEVTTAVAE